MSRIFDLNTNWKVTQDTDDLGEKLGIWDADFKFDRCSHLISNWEGIDRLASLQILYSDTPYYGRELRYFNHAPWWYCNDFEYVQERNEKTILSFSSVDYYAKVWLNGTYLGQHSGYFDGFDFDITNIVREKNHLVVKVSAPWDRTILENAEAMRCYSVKREMVKGTYEHADGFIQRDVNPIGILGPVTIKGSYENSLYDNSLEVSATLSDSLKEGRVSVKGSLVKEGGCMVLTLIDKEGGIAARKEAEVEKDFDLLLDIDSPQLWTTWERGVPYLYTLRIELVQDGVVLDRTERRIGFRNIRLERNKDITRFRLNGTDIYLRGTSYFADVYLSEMSRHRYYKDLRLIKDSGFNAVRVHVHVEKKDFYEICDELGLLVIQDSDFNWDHPTTRAWLKEAEEVFGKMISTLKGHPSIICWVVLNEPDVWKIFTGGLLEQTKEDELMLQTLCSSLLSTLKAIDPDRPYIKASREEDDPESGDTHTYIGSLATGTDYTDIAGTKEKLNSEFGMDIPSCEQSLYKDRRIFRRLLPIIPKLDELQYYQYKLVKYYIEHYRMQKYYPCSGYFQFMFIDLCPQSFYGIFDYYGIPKPGYRAVLESGQPVGVFARRVSKDEMEIMIANDLLKEFDVDVRYAVKKDGIAVKSGRLGIKLPPDSLVEAGSIHQEDLDGLELDLVIVDRSGKELSRNHYDELFKEMPHIKGHSLELDNEIGMRLFQEEA